MFTTTITPPTPRYPRTFMALTGLDTAEDLAATAARVLRVGDIVPADYISDFKAATAQSAGDYDATLATVRRWITAR